MRYPCPDIKFTSLLNMSETARLEWFAYFLLDGSFTLKKWTTDELEFIVELSTKSVAELYLMRFICGQLGSIERSKKDNIYLNR